MSEKCSELFLIYGIAIVNMSILLFTFFPLFFILSVFLSQNIRKK